MFTLTPYQRSPWSLMDELEALQKDMNRAFGAWTPIRSTGRSSKSYPPVNVWSSEEGIIVDAEVPGVDVKDVDILVEGDQLTIRGKVNFEKPKEGETYHRRERNSGEFVRTLQLPFKANAEGVKANHKNGILRITVPRAEEDKPRKVSIEVA